MAAPSTEQRELELVEKVEFKILAVANKEEKLHELLRIYLAPLILKAASDHVSVRNKVLRTVASLRIYIQPPQVVLPVKALLQQYKSHDSPIVKQLDIPFIQHSVDRLDVEDRRELLPIALQGFAADAASPRAAAMVNLVLRLLLDARIPSRGSPESAAFRDSVGLSAEADAEHLAHVLGLLFRLCGRQGAKTLAQSNPALSQDELALFPEDRPETDKILDRLTKLKAKAMEFLASAAFTDEERFLPAICAAAGPDNKVAQMADDVIKRSAPSLEDESTVRSLFQAHSTMAAAYRIRILAVLSKSTASARMPDVVMGVVSRNLTSLHVDGQDDVYDANLPRSDSERQKLHLAVFDFLGWVSRFAPPGPDYTIWPQLIDALHRYITALGWPVPRQPTPNEKTLRQRAYETIGMLAQSARLPAAERLTLGHFLFRSLSEDPTGDIAISINGALSSLAAGDRPSFGSEEARLKSMLLEFMRRPDDKPPAVRSTRHAVVKWANHFLPFSDFQARWINIMAAGGRPNEQKDVSEEGLMGLDPCKFCSRSDSKLSLLDWEKMVGYFFASVIDPDWDSTPRTSTMHFPSYDVFRNFTGGRELAFDATLLFCKRILLRKAFEGQAACMPKVEQDVQSDSDVRDRVRAYLRTVHPSSLTLFLEACLRGALGQHDEPLAQRCAECFVQVASLCPANAVGPLAEAFGPILCAKLRSNNKEKRRLVAEAVGIVAANPATPDFLSDDFWTFRFMAFFEDMTNPLYTHSTEGALLALGHLHSRCVYYGRGHDIPRDFQYPIHLVLDQDIPPSLREAAIECFSLLWAARLALPSPVGQYSTGKIIQKLAAGAKARLGSETVITALGSLAVGLDDTEDAQTLEAGQDGEDRLFRGFLGAIVKELLSLHEQKSPRLLFCVGHALSAAAARWESKHFQLGINVDTGRTNFQAGVRAPFLDALVERLLRDSKASKPSLLNASGIWLYSIVSSCSHLPALRGRLRQIQAAFMRLLVAKDDIVQFCACRGLALIYERGDADLKSALIKDFVSGFTKSGTKPEEADKTDLLEPGVLLESERSKAASYKEFVNLANEAGDPRLIYKFILLAADARLQSSPNRLELAGPGLDRLLAASEVDPKLYPKLYRYLFDPNRAVQKPMEAIWKALVKDPNATLDAHFCTVLEDLLKSVLGREVRMREASCAAIAALIQGRPFSRYEAYYQRIWSVALKVLDDMHDTVRKAALNLCQNLSSGLVRQLEENNQARAAASMMQEVVPFLLSPKGMENSAKDVRGFATKTVLEIAKHGGQALRPFIPDLVVQLLGLLSTIEPDQVNSHYQRATAEDRVYIDKLRATLANSSPVSDAIDNCLRLVDAEAMAKLGPRLEETIKTAVGTATKIGCSRALTTLATRHADDTRPMASRFVQLLEKQVLDRNEEVSQSYAAAAAYMLRVAPDAVLAGFCQRTVNSYLQSEGEGRRRKTALVVAAVARLSPERFTAHEAELVPLSYLGSHDTDDYSRKQFGDVWSQHGGTKRTVLRYVPEIVALAEACLGTAQWALHHAAAFTVAAMVVDVAGASDTTGRIGRASLEVIWPVLDRSLALRTFPGKEKLLESYPVFVEHGRELWGEEPQVAAQMKKIAIREAKRNKDDYRVHALGCLWRFAKAREDLDMLQEIVDVARPHLEAQKEEDAMDTKPRGERAEPDMRMQTAKSAVQAVARGYAPSTGRDLGSTVRSIMDSLWPYLSSGAFDAIKREVWYECVCDLMRDAAAAASSAGGGEAATSSDGSGTLAALVESLDLARAEAGKEPQRLMRVKALRAILQAQAEGVFGPAEGTGDVEQAIEAAMGEEVSPTVRTAWMAALDDARKTREQQRLGGR
ncbi:hypothetical protein CDD83_9383 [Cordyceps sp. RAO-2017]|nr:hypothetical protein CDD83_9383 [Cordyceps sp. RAO-2017]